jgi:hypothetical protein
MTPDHPLYDQIPTSRRWVKILLGVVVAGLAAMWVYAFLFAPRDNVNALGDGAWTKQAELDCAAADKAMLALPNVPNLDDTSQPALNARADVLEQSNAILDDLLDTLSRSLPNDEEGARIATLWLEDYRAYAKDRELYVEGLRAGSQTKFAESTIDQMPISNFINDVARQNKMPSCQAPPLS